ncbi:hypothetical protein HG536_0A03370 [Torulaspora globosa]|uniref:DNA mismatch repair protein S5 domain-containing protein n=1 Tax=Torulaspora globosa TaxID=48254 RepID=A0A7G3ZAI3_9SACH|nr:uncharacterized protein HG536_0A03370 [Torulaspora globosa]QLL30519.1 hypothetical protein HG536_0A03370 [Torulaspora globosa]
MTIKEIEDTSKWRLVSSSIIPDPKHAVKELIDNAIDAGATSIYVDIDSNTSGCHYICVRDDGSGVDKADRNAMCLNHATSKIRSQDDLSHLKTLGFRGQALFSLATLANKKGSMEITTKSKSESVGEKWLVPKDGLTKGIDRKKVSCPSGTTVLIKNLLLGLRARYLHTVARAARSNEEIHRLTQHYSLIFRSIRFHFCLVTVDKDGQVTRKQLQQSLEPNLSRVRALSIASKLRSPVSDNFLVNDNLPVNKFIHLNVILPRMQPQTDVCGLNKNKRFLSVNNRIISLQLNFGTSVAKIVNKIYREANLMDPTTWYINFECDARILDVNVEPGKNDVMIKDVSIVMRQLEESLSAYIVAELGKKGCEEIEMTGRIPRRPGICQEATVTSQKPGNNGGVSTVNGDQHAGKQGEIKRNESLLPSANENVRSVGSTSALRCAKRQAASDYVYPDEIRWKCNLNSDDAVGTQEVTNRHCSSSLESSPIPGCENEDMEVARNISLSNPFMIAKLKHFSVKQRKIEVPQKNLDNSSSHDSADVAHLESRRYLESAPTYPRADFKQPSLSSTCGDTTLIDEEIVDEERIGHKACLASRRLRLYSEHTEGVTQSVDYNYGKYSQSAYKNELQWLSRDSDPKNRVTESLIALSKDLKDKRISLSRAKEGWFILTN